MQLLLKFASRYNIIDATLTQRFNSLQLRLREASGKAEYGEAERGEDAQQVSQHAAARVGDTLQRHVALMTLWHRGRKGQSSAAGDALAAAGADASEDGLLEEDLAAYERGLQ